MQILDNSSFFDNPCTDAAERVVLDAKAWAKENNYSLVGRIHLLLGLLREGDHTSDYLLRTGILRHTYDELYALASSWQLDIRMLERSNYFQKVVEAADDEVTRLEEEYINTHHILIAMIGAGEQTGRPLACFLEHSESDTFVLLRCRPIFSLLARRHEEYARIREANER